MATDCSHEYAEPAVDEATGDHVQVCCHCDRTLGPISPHELPARWYTHSSLRGRHPQAPLLAAEVINGDYPDRSTSGRVVHACGACGHHLTAVHAEYFSRHEDPPHDLEGFFDNLAESLCPECGTALFRNTSVVGKRGNLIRFQKEGPGLTTYIFNRNDDLYWSGKTGSGRLPRTVYGGVLRDLGDYYHRCPGCGYAEKYGNREFDFHHWDYEDDIGCILCRNCHEHIHRGLSASEQAEKVTCGWRADAIERLHDLSVQNGLQFDGVELFRARYNIPLDIFDGASSSWETVLNGAAGSSPITGVGPDGRY